MKVLDRIENKLFRLEVKLELMIEALEHIIKTVSQEDFDARVRQKKIAHLRRCGIEA